MNRELKFRGLSLNGEWRIGYVSVIKVKMPNQPPEPGSYISNSVGRPFAYAVRPETVGQYTGLKDRNGKEIYEGDIVTPTYEVKPVEVRFETSEVASCGCCYQSFDGSGFMAKGVDLSDCEVIGNIYGNPELLNQQS